MLYFTFLKNDKWNRGSFVILLAFACCLVTTGLLAQAPPYTTKLGFNQAAADLSQARNGEPSEPVSPIDWQNGNLGAETSHYVEGYSIPYIAELTGLPTQQQLIDASGDNKIHLILEYDIKHSGKHAIDYLTHYDRLEPHAMFLHAAEDVNPIYDPDPQPRELFPPGTPPTSTFGIPAPTSINSPVAGMPTNSFNALPALEKVFTMWGGTITAVSYGPQGDLNAEQSAQQIYVSFIPNGPYAVLSWGGHIGSRNDWGFETEDEPRSAGGITGSPYHMRLIDWNLDNLGNQDRSLSAAAIVEPPDPCDAALALCEEENGTATFDLTLATDDILCEENTIILGWFEDATLLVPIATPTAFVAANGDKAYANVQNTVTSLTNVAEVSLTVYPGLTLSLDDNDITCFGLANGSIALTVNGGTAPFSYDWSNDATTEDISGLAPGTYSVLVTDANGCTATGEATISQPPAIAYTVQDTDISCYGDANGTITVTVTSGVNVSVFLNGVLMTQNGNIWTATGLGPGNYTVTATAPGNEGATCNGPQQGVVISQPDQIAYTVQHTDVTCSGEDDGSIEVTVTSGVNVTVFLNGAPMTNEGGGIWTAGGLAAGLYTVTASAPGNNGATCNAPPTDVTIEGISEIDLDIAHTDVTCYGEADGTITVTVTAGENVSVFLNGVLMTNVANVWTADNLAPGNYVITSSAPGNEGTTCPGPGDAVLIEQPDEILLTVESTDITCYGAADGTITVTVTSGENVTVFLNGAPMANVANVWTAEGLAPGNYTVTSSAPGNEGATCPGPTQPVLLEQPDEILLAVESTDITCYGEADGTITVTVTSGENVTVFLNGAPMTNVANVWTAEGLAPGNYAVTSSAPGNEGAICPGPGQAVVLEQPDEILLTVESTDVTCYGEADGTITVTVTSGENVTVFLNGAPMANVANVWTAEGLAPGNYTVTSSAPGNEGATCPGPTQPVLIEQPAEILIGVESTDVTCYGEADGTITVTVTSGANVTVFLNGAPMTQNGNVWTATGLGPGNYLVTSSAPGNEGAICPGPEYPVVIDEPDEITYTVDHTDITCFEDGDGTITVVVTGGQNVTILIDGIAMNTGDGIVWTATGLGPGNYVITSLAPGLEDAICAGPTENVTIIEPQVLSCNIPDPGYSVPLCGGYQNNLLQVIATGGTGAYSYSWSVDNLSWAIIGLGDGPSINLQAGEGPATFTVIVTDENGCTTSCTFQLQGCDAEDFCTYTQGFYGTPGGKTCSVNGPGMSPQDLMLSVLPVGQSYTFGIAANNRSFTLYGTDIANGNIFNMLPGGGTPSALGVFAGGASYGNVASWPSVPLSKKASTYGSINNNLLSQTITLFFNLGQNNDPSLASFELETTIVTAESTDCGETMVVPLQDQVATVPLSVINYLNNNYAGGATVGNLFDLANRILGGDPALVTPTNKGYNYLFVSAADVTAAVDAINRIFDECRIYVPNNLRDAELRSIEVESGTRVASATEAVLEEQSQEIDASAYPVPFETEVTIEFSVPYDTRAVVDMYSLDGKKVSTLFDQDVKANQSQRVTYTPNDSQALYIYRITTNRDVKHGKILRR